jgi:hypothetical protein
VSLELCLAMTRQMNPNMAAKSAKSGKVINLTHCKHNQRFQLVFGWQEMFNLEIMMECIWQKFYIKVSTMKYHVNCISNSEICKFKGTILM